MASSGRDRRVVLGADLRVGGILVLAFAWPLVCVRVAWVALQYLAIRNATPHLIAAALILLALSFITLVPQPLRRLRPSAARHTILTVVIPAVATFLVFATTAGAPIAVVIAPIAMATFVAALAEEAVFRRFLPDRLAGVLQSAGTRPIAATIAIVLIPQMAFAIAHAENSAYGSALTGEFIRLFIAGVLYQGVARIAGLWAAAGLHAALNLSIAIAASAGPWHR